MGFFDDVTSIVINNKEVQSIITSDGGVIYEKPSGWELVLTGDKSVMMTGETATLTATLTNNNVPQSGKSIIFCDANYTPFVHLYDGTYNLNRHLGNSFSIYYLPQGGTHISIDSSNLHIILTNSGLVRMSDDNHTWTNLFTTKTSLNLNNGVLFDDEGHSYDISSYDNDFTLTTIYGAGSVYLEFYGVAITNVNGVATVGYTGKGTGDLNIQAYYLERIISSEIYLIEDCILFQSNPSPCTNCNIALPNSAEISFKMSKPRITGSYGGVHLEFVDNTSHTYFVGNWASAGENGFLIRNAGSSSNLVALLGTHIAANTEYLLGVTYKDNAWTYFKDNEISSGTANYTPTKISVIHIQQGTMKDLKIKPL